MSILIFIFGAIIGSFLNVVVVRIWEGTEVVQMPSHCPYCKRRLHWYELIPILSFIALRARCKTCHARISSQYPLVEAGTGIVFVLLFNNFFAGVSLISIALLSLYFIFGSLLILLFVFDFKYLVIPDRFLYPALGLSILIALIQFDTFINHALSAALVGGIFAIMVYASRERAMGSGDIFLALIMGFVLGWPHILPAFVLAFFVGAFVGVGLMMSGKKSLKMHIPFGPFLIGSLFIVWLWGPHIIDLYLGALGL